MKLFVYPTLWLIASAVPTLSFVGPTAFSPRRTTSLNMVADDAKVVMITGASQGLGQAIAYEMAKAEQKVIVNYIAGCEAGAEETVQKCKDLGGDAVAIEADCSNPDQVHEMFKKAIDAYGGVDVLVNNAGVTRDNLVARMKPADWNLVLSVNLSGVFYCMQEFFKVNEKKGDGRVINMASVVGQIGNPGQANYAASKGGVIGLTKSCAREMGPKGIKINAICEYIISGVHRCNLVVFS